MDLSESMIGYKGDIFLALKYTPSDMNQSRRANKSGTSTSSKGELHVLLKEAHSLMATRSNGKHNDLRERCLELTLWDYDKITSNDFLGGVRLGLGLGEILHFYF